MIEKDIKTYTTHTYILAETPGLWVRDQSFTDSSSTGEE